LELDSGLALAMVVGGLLTIPLFGFLPMLAIGAAIATSYFIISNIRPK